MKKKRRYNTRRVRRSRSYTLQEIAALFDIHINAVHQWRKAGLESIDNQRPYRVHGSDLIAFLSARQKKRKHPCKLNEAYCCKCRQAQPFWENTIDIIIRSPARLNLSGLCPVCSTAIFKGGSVKKLPEYHKTFHVQTLQGQHLIGSCNPSVMCD